MADIRIDGIKDVERLLHGTHESQHKIQVAVGADYVQETPREVGERWFDADGNEWEQKEGYKIKLGKEWQQELHQYLNTFPNCPKEVCTCALPKRLDEKMKILHGLCFDCVLRMEHKIRLAGKWDEYESGKLKENAYAWLREMEADKDMIASELSKVEFTNDFGDLEKWDVGKTKDEILEKIEAEFEKFKNDFINKIELGDEANTENDIERSDGDA